jgi:hypothetical protein
MQTLLYILGGLVVGFVLMLIDEYWHDRQWDQQRRQPSVWEQQQAVMRRRKREVIRRLHRITQQHRR